MGADDSASARRPVHSVSWAALLGLGAGLCWGGADFLGGLQSRHLHVLAVVAWSEIAGSIVSLAILGFLGERPPLDGVAWGFAGGAVGGLAVIAFYRGLAIGQMSVVAPISACGAVLPVVVAFARGETPTALETAGIVVAVTGVVLVSRARTRADQEPVNRRAALGMALIAALGFGAFFVLVERGSATTAGSPLWVVVGTRFGALATMGVIASFRPEARRWPGRRVVAVSVVGVLDAMASALFAYASTRGNLGVTAVLASQYPAVTVILARIRLSERMSPGQALGVGLALTGVMLLATG